MSVIEGQAGDGRTYVLPLNADGTAVAVEAGSALLVTGSATAANQTNGSQKTQVVDGSGNVAPVGDAAARASFVKVTNGTQTMPTGDAATRPIYVRLTDGSAAIDIIAALTALQNALQDPTTFTAITPSDSTDVTSTCTKGIFVAVTGNVNVTGVGGSAVSLGTQVAGTTIPGALSRVNAATTATVFGRSGP